MSQLPDPPSRYTQFIEQFPKLGEAWQQIAEAGREGPLDARTARLVKLAVAIGALRQGPVHASARKARAMGISEEELAQVVALSAGTLGLPSAVAAFSWLQDDAGE